MSNKKEIPKGLIEAFAVLDKLNDDSSILEESALSNITGYIDTGSMALNAIISGSLYSGVPKGRIIGFAGPESSGKTLIMSKILANAQKTDPDVYGVIFDSENAFDKNVAKNVGANCSKIKHNPIESVEDCRNQICTFLDKIIPHKDLYGKILIIIDSLGNLASTKEIEDAKKGKHAVDMGMRAKAIKSMMRTLTYKCAKTNTTLLFANHVYDDPTLLFPGVVKNQSGGKGPMYLASVLVQLGVKTEKEEGTENVDVIPIAFKGAGGKIVGVNLSALTIKNRVIPPFLKTSIFLNFKNGLDKYSGLLDMVLGYEIVIQTGSTYQLKDGTKLGYYKNWKSKDDIWKPILEDLEKTIQKEFVFSSTADKINQQLKESSDEETG